MRRHRDVAAMVRSSTSSYRTARLCHVTISGQCVVCTISVGFFILLLGTFLAIFSIEGQHSHKYRHRPAMSMVKIVSYSLIGIGAGIALSACGLYALALNLGRDDEDDISEYHDTRQIIERTRSISEDVEAATSAGNIQHNGSSATSLSWNGVMKL